MKKWSEPIGDGRVLGDIDLELVIDGDLDGVAPMDDPVVGFCDAGIEQPVAACIRAEQLFMEAMDAPTRASFRS